MSETIGRLGVAIAGSATVRVRAESEGAMSMTTVRDVVIVFAGAIVVAGGRVGVPLCCDDRLFLDKLARAGESPGGNSTDEKDG